MNLNLSNKQMLCIGTGIFLLLIILNSTKKVSLKEVLSTPDNKAFDSSILPVFLKPPKRLDEGEPLPQTATPKRSLTGISFHKRFDR